MVKQPRATWWNSEFTASQSDCCCCCVLLSAGIWSRFWGSPSPRRVSHAGSTACWATTSLKSWTPSSTAPTTLHYTILYYTTQYYTTQYYITLHNTTQYYTTLRYPVSNSTVLYYTIQYKISMNKTILTIFKYGQWIKGITKSMLGERQHNESIIEINYPI